MPIIWSDSLKTGIDVIDFQHQRLFETINKLNKVKTIKMTFYEVLLELRVYVSEHFKAEEKFMECSKYPEYSHHKECHDNFVEEYKNFFKKIMQSSDVIEHADEMILFVENWIEQHYTYEDIRMADYLKKYFKIIMKLNS